MEDSDNKSDPGTDSVHNEDQHNESQHNEGQHNEGQHDEGQYDEDQHKQHDEGQHDEDQHKQHDGFEQHDEGKDDTAPGLPDDPQLGSPHSWESIPSPSSTCSVPSTNASSPSSSGSFSDLDHVQPDALSVYREKPDVPEDLTVVAENSTEYKEMRKCVNTAMSILSRTRTRNAMAIYSIGVVDSVETPEPKQSTAGNLDVYGAGMQHAISNWLEILRQRFPEIYISPSIGSCYGSTERFTWGEHIGVYDPDKAAAISIHAGVCSQVSFNLYFRC